MAAGPGLDRRSPVIRTTASLRAERNTTKKRGGWYNRPISRFPSAPTDEPALTRLRKALQMENKRRKDGTGFSRVPSAALPCNSVQPSHGRRTPNPVCRLNERDRDVTPHFREARKAVVALGLFRNFCRTATVIPTPTLIPKMYLFPSPCR